MRRAAKISAAAHQRAMRAARPGMREYELEAAPMPACCTTPPATPNCATATWC
ncbi:Xaa-Pro aminopeptidase [Bordetella pertussis]|nr:Xaa-Pro aminopeptidase [Bordetella pertussis]